MSMLIAYAAADAEVLGVFVCLLPAYRPHGWTDRDETWQAYCAGEWLEDHFSNSRFDIPFSRKREKSIFVATVPTLGAIFS